MDPLIFCFLAFLAVVLVVIFVSFAEVDHQRRHRLLRTGESVMGAAGLPMTNIPWPSEAPPAFQNAWMITISEGDVFIGSSVAAALALSDPGIPPSGMAFPLDRVEATSDVSAEASLTQRFAGLDYSEPLTPSLVHQSEPVKIDFDSSAPIPKM